MVKGARLLSESRRKLAQGFESLALRQYNQRRKPIMDTHCSILAVDRAYTPDAWIDAPTAINLYARGLVLNAFGDSIMRLRGGTNAITGRQSIIEVQSILVVDTLTRAFKSDDCSPFNRELMFKRDRNICAYCGDTFKSQDLELEHIVPQCQGGGTSWTNCCSACPTCNRRKGGRTPEQAGMPLLYLPYRPSRFEWLILKNRNILADQMEFISAMLPKHSRCLS